MLYRDEDTNVVQSCKIQGGKQTLQTSAKLFWIFVRISQNFRDFDRSNTTITIFYDIFYKSLKLAENMQAFGATFNEIQFFFNIPCSILSIQFGP